MRLNSMLVIAALAFPALAQPPRMPNAEAQREAMKKLEFLVGTWSGDAKVQFGQSGPIELTQTEEVQYKLGGLILLIEGTGRAKSDGKVAFNALATISYDDAAQTYRIRAYNEGRYVDTELKLAFSGKGFTWGLEVGPVKTSYVMQINDKGEWVETGEFVMGTQPPRKFVELTVRRQK